MADQLKQIKEFPNKADFGDEDLLLIQGAGTTYHVKGTAVKRYAEDSAKPQVALAAAQAQAAAKSAEESAASAVRSETAVEHPPMIDYATGLWLVWDRTGGNYVPTDIRAVGKDFEILGYYGTLEKLEAAVTDPEPGDAYGVGEEPPYDVYIWDGVNLVWKNNGTLLNSGDMTQSVYDPEKRRTDVFAYADKRLKEALDADVGRSMAGKEVQPAEGTTVTAGAGAEIFNDYRERTFGTDEGYEAVIAWTGNIASGSYAHAEGLGTTASGANAHAEGVCTTASGANSHVEGGRMTGHQGSAATAYAAHAEGSSTIASAGSSHSEGMSTRAGATGCHAEGYETEVTETGIYGSHAEGYQTVASGDRGAHAEGCGTTASGAQAHAEGYGTIASAARAHAEGRTTQATGQNSHAEGYAGIAEGSASHVEGGQITNYEGNKASGYAAHAEGASTLASGNQSHAEGQRTTASGINSHAEGVLTEASGANSHAEGYATIAKASNSHAGGLATIAAGMSQTVLGHANIENDDSTNALIVGKGTVVNGEATVRANSFRVTSNGVFASGNYNASGADYAERFEWADGNPDGEDRAGLFVTLIGPHICVAGPGDGYLLGIVSGSPSIVGDVYDDQWKGMYLTDVFGRPLWEEVEVPEVTEEREIPEMADTGRTDEAGNPIFEEIHRKETVVLIPAHKERRQKLNPAYDPAQRYIPQSERPEKENVGLLGKLVALEDGSCQVDGWCTAGEGGRATACESRTRFRVMEKLTDPETGRKCVRVMILPGA